MNKTALAFAAFIALSGNAFAASPAFIDQVGPNTAPRSVTLENLVAPVAVMQATFSAGRAALSDPLAGLAIIVQEGEGHLTSIDQHGTGNLGLVSQYGLFHSASLVQVGHNNNAAITQWGYGNSASISQHGSNHNAMVMQQGRGNVAIISQR